MSRLRCIALILFLEILLLLAAAVTYRLAIASFLIRSDAPQKADAIIVLGGETGNFYRTMRGVALFDSGYAPVVVFSGGTLLGAGLECSSAKLSLEAAVNLGLPPEACILLDGSQSTLDEAHKIDSLRRQRSWSRLILITDVFHSRRAHATFRNRLADVHILCCPVHSPEIDPRYWWRHENSLVAVFNETIKVVFYAVRFGIN